MSADTGHLEAHLGYRFRDDALLARALTHRSAGTVNNERLEFLGDAILGFVVAHALFDRFPDASEGELSRLRASLVRRETLAELASPLSLGDFIRLGAGELKSGGFRRASTLADAVEAVIGAVYLDGGLPPARDLTLRLLDAHLSKLSLDTSHKDPKTRLQEFLQARKLQRPQYEIIAVAGADHAQQFSARCRIPDLELEAVGEGSSRRRAEQAAAVAILRTLEDDG